MADVTVHERLRHARAASGLDLTTLAQRSGVRLDHLRAIEDGRFGDLPPGIYARAALRSFAAASGLDPREVLADCEALLPAIADPIAALGRMRGVRHDREGVSATSGTAGRGSNAPPASGAALCRALAATALDACAIGALLTIVIFSAAALIGVRTAALRPSAIAVALVGLVLAGGYFVWFGGLAGTTIGGQVMGLARGGAEAAPLTLQAIAARAWQAATRDARGIRCLGMASGARRNALTAQRCAP